MYLHCQYTLSVHIVGIPIHIHQVHFMFIDNVCISTTLVYRQFLLAINARCYEEFVLFCYCRSRVCFLPFGSLFIVAAITMKSVIYLEFKVNEYVLAHMRTYCPWPARIIQIRKESCVVKFYGDNNRM